MPDADTDSHAEPSRWGNRAVLWGAAAAGLAIIAVAVALWLRPRADFELELVGETGAEVAAIVEVDGRRRVERLTLPATLRFNGARLSYRVIYANGGEDKELGVLVRLKRWGYPPTADTDLGRLGGVRGMVSITRRGYSGGMVGMPTWKIEEMRRELGIAGDSERAEQPGRERRVE